MLQSYQYLFEKKIKHYVDLWSVLQISLSTQMVQHSDSVIDKLKKVMSKSYHNETQLVKHKLNTINDNVQHTVKPDIPLMSHVSKNNDNDNDILKCKGSQFTPSKTKIPAVPPLYPDNISDVLK